MHFDRKIIWVFILCLLPFLIVGMDLKTASNSTSGVINDIGGFYDVDEKGVFEPHNGLIQPIISGINTLGVGGVAVGGIDEKANGSGNGEIDGETDGPGNGEIDTETNNPGNGEIDTETNNPGNGEIDTETNNPGNGEIDEESNGHGNGEIDEEANGPGNGEIDEEANGPDLGEIDGESDGSNNEETDTQANGSTNGEIDTQANGHGNGEIDTQTNGPDLGEIDEEANGPDLGEIDEEANGPDLGEIGQETNGHGNGEIDQETNGSFNEEIDQETNGSFNEEIDEETTGSIDEEIDEETNDLINGEINEEADNLTGTIDNENTEDEIDYPDDKEQFPSNTQDLEESEPEENLITDYEPQSGEWDINNTKELTQTEPETNNIESGEAEDSGLGSKIEIPEEATITEDSGIPLEPELEPGLESELESGLESELESGLESELESGLEPELEPGLESELESGLESELEPGLESELEPMPELVPELLLAKLASNEINATSLVVYNFNELNLALSKSNQYTNIYLGANIQMEAGGIEIHSGKKSVSISGINPLDGSGPYTIDEYNSIAPGYTIRVISDTGTKEVTVKDINIIGRNFYGAICVYDGVNNVNVTFENVNYNGPQIMYNRGGALRIIGNSYVNIIGSNGLSDAHELAEVNSLELGGNTVIEHYAPVVSGLWLVGSDSSITILPRSKVIWRETGAYMIFQDSLVPANLILERDAHFTIHTPVGLFYNNSLLYHQFGNVLINPGAKLEIIQNNLSSSSTPLLKVKNSFNLLDNASLIMIAHQSPQLLYMTGAADINFQKPDTLVLYNMNNPLIEWSDTGDHRISILSTFINYWQTPCDLSLLGGFDDSPLYRWRKKDGALLSVDITVSSAVTKSVSSNYSGPDYGTAPTTDSFNVNSASLLTIGRLPLILDNVTDTSESILGETEPYGLLKVLYTDNQNTDHIIWGQADSGGFFDIAFPNGALPLLDSEITVYSSMGYKNVMEKTIVTTASDNSLMFLHVPSRLSFPATSIGPQQELIQRADEHWHIIISDSRSPGSQWGLYTRLLSPLAGIQNQTEYIIEDGVVFFKPDGSRSIIGNDTVKISGGIKDNNLKTTINWPAEQGILLDIDTLKVYSNIPYQARLEWLLIDGP